MRAWQDVVSIWLFLLYRIALRNSLKYYINNTSIGLEFSDLSTHYSGPAITCIRKVLVDDFVLSVWPKFVKATIRPMAWGPSRL